MKSKKILTIAIPTYNRSHYLKECLDHICHQLIDEVEVVVRDNKSDNYDFWSFIRPYQENYGVIPIQNKTNVGGDINIARCFEECETKWLLVVGDDDYLKENAIINIISIIKNNPNDIFIKVNSPYVGRTRGLKGFAKAMGVENGFISIFFTSEGLHNIEKTKEDIYTHYRYVSLKIAQIIRVMIRLRNNPDATCFFSSVNILASHGGDISWNRTQLIIPYLTIFDVFRQERRIFKCNINHTIAGTLFRYISLSELSGLDKMYYYMQTIRKYGWINSIRYNYRSLARVIVVSIFGKSALNN